MYMHKHDYPFQWKKGSSEPSQHNRNINIALQWTTNSIEMRKKHIFLSPDDINLRTAHNVHDSLNFHKILKYHDDDNGIYPFLIKTFY